MESNPSARTMFKLQVAASLLLPLSTLAQHAQQQSDRATVLLFDATGASSSSSSSSSDGIKTYSAPHANAIISSFLNIEEYERLPEGLELPEQIVLAAAATPQEQRTRTQPLMILAERLGAEGSLQGALNANSAGVPTLTMLRSCADYISETTLDGRSHHQLQVGQSPDSHTWLSLLSRYKERLAEKFGFEQHVQGSSEEEDHVKRFLLPGSMNGEYAIDASMQDEVIYGTR